MVVSLKQKAEEKAMGVEGEIKEWAGRAVRNPDARVDLEIVVRRDPL